MMQREKMKLIRNQALVEIKIPQKQFILSCRDMRYDDSQKQISEKNVITSTRVFRRVELTLHIIIMVNNPGIFH